MRTQRARTRAAAWLRRARLARRERAEGYVQYAVLVTMALVVAVAVLAFGQTLVQLFGRLGQNLLGIGG